MRVQWRAGSRASRPGSRRAVWLGGAVVALAAVAVAVVVVLSAGGGSRTGAPVVRYGGIPSWLPKPKVAVNRIAAASVAHPWLAIEGDTVSVRLAGGRVLATAVGPAVPEEGRFPVPATTRCSFTVTFTAASGSVPLRARDLTILDELGGVHHPRVTAAGGALPRFVRPGRSVTIAVSAVLPTGNGQLRWAPAAARPVVSWDFDVEID